MTEECDDVASAVREAGADAREFVNDKPLAEHRDLEDDDPLLDAVGGGKGTPPELRLSHVGLMNAGTTTEAVVSGAVHATHKLLHIERDEEPSSEFSGNGVRLMETFWYDFILGNGLHEYEGTISTTATRHLMQHYTLRFQANKGLVLLLANQAQRHRVLRSVTGAVRPGKSDEFMKMAGDPELLETLERAAENPRSSDGKKVLTTISPLVALCAKQVPWGAAERGSCIAQLLAMMRRYGPASLFLTMAPDDVHNPLGIRLTIRTRSTDTFPAVPGDFMAALQSQPSSLECGEQGSADFGEVIFEDTYKLEDFLQGQAAGHPASTSMMFDEVADTVLSVLCGTPPRRHTRKTYKLSDREKGIWGTGVACFAVVEETGRGAHHLHAAIWCGALPGLVSGSAIRQETFDHLRRILDKQFRSSVEDEVHVLHAVRRALHKVPLHRPEFHERPNVLESVSRRGGSTVPQLSAEFKRTAEHIAIVRQWHRHTATCEKLPQGACGCRMCMPAGHPVHTTRAVEVKPVAAPDNQQTAEEWEQTWPPGSWTEGHELSCGIQLNTFDLRTRCGCCPRDRSVLNSSGEVWTSISSTTRMCVHDGDEPSIPASAQGAGDEDVASNGPSLEDVFNARVASLQEEQTKGECLDQRCFVCECDDEPPVVEGEVSPAVRQFGGGDDSSTECDDDEHTNVHGGDTHRSGSEDETRDDEGSEDGSGVEDELGDDEGGLRSGFERLVPREEPSRVVVELARPRLRWPSDERVADVQGQLEEAKQQGRSKQTTCSIWMELWSEARAHYPGVAEELKKAEWAEVKARLEAEVGTEVTAKVRPLTAPELKKLVDNFLGLPCANANVTTFNHVLTELLHCNTAPYLLGAREASKGACFYLVKYMTKDSVALNTSLSLLVDAKKHIDKYESTADDKGEVRRTGLHFLQRAVNSYMAEVHDTQAASLLLNLNASYTSERFVWVDGWAAVHEGRAAIGKDGNLWGAGAPDGMVGAETESDDDDDIAEIGAETEWLREKRETENEDDKSRGRGRTYEVEDYTEVVSMITHYRLRGIPLERFNYQEYEGCITIVKKTEKQRDDFKEKVEAAGEATMDEQRRRGRRANYWVSCGPIDHCSTCKIGVAAPCVHLPPLTQRHSPNAADPNLAAHPMPLPSLNSTWIIHCTATITSASTPSSPVASTPAGSHRVSHDS